MTETLSDSFAVLVLRILGLDPQDLARLLDDDLDLVHVLLGLVHGLGLGDLDGLDLDLGLGPALDLDRAGDVADDDLAVLGQGLDLVELLLDLLLGEGRQRVDGQGQQGADQDRPADGFLVFLFMTSSLTGI